MKVMQNIDLDATGIKDIFSNIPKQKQCLFLMMASSGLSLIDILNLTLKDIDFKADSVSITLRRQMSGHVFTTFISREAAITLNQYIGEKGITSPEEKIFAFNARRLLTIWRKASEKAGYEKLRLFEIRKFFYRMARTMTNETVAELLLGHGKNLKNIDISKEMLADFYMEIEPRLIIFVGCRYEEVVIE